MKMKFQPIAKPCVHALSSNLVFKVEKFCRKIFQTRVWFKKHSNFTFDRGES